MKAAFGKVYDLEKRGGSIIGGVINLMQNKKNNPTPAREIPSTDPNLQDRLLVLLKRA